MKTIDSMEQTTDESIVKEVQNGTTDLFGELILRYEAKLKRYARKFLSYQEDIDDLVQDVFIKAYTSILSFDTSMRFSPWLYQIAHNTFVNELRRKGRYSVSIFDADTFLPQLHAKETADEATLSAELRAEMDTLLSQLKPKYREVVVLHYFEDLSYEAISEILKIPITTVGVRLLRGRQELRKLYTKQ